MLRRHISQTATTISARKYFVQPIEIHAMCTMHMSKFSGASFEENLNGSFIVFSDYELNRAAKLPDGKEVLHVIKPERGYLHELTGN